MFNIKFSLCCCFFCFYAKLKLIEIIQFEVLQTTILSFFSGCCFKKKPATLHLVIIFGGSILSKFDFPVFASFPSQKLLLGLWAIARLDVPATKKKYIYNPHYFHFIYNLFLKEVLFWKPILPTTSNSFLTHVKSHGRLSKIHLLLSQSAFPHH